MTRAFHAILHDAHHIPVGCFSLDGGPGRALQRWEWFGNPWPATTFYMAPRPVALPADPALSDTYVQPSVALAHGSAGPRGLSGPLYEVLRLDDRRRIAVLVVDGGTLRWLEPDAGGFHALAPAPLVFCPMPRLPSLAGLDRTLIQAPVRLGASFGAWTQSA